MTIDWSKAPKGATHWHEDYLHNLSGGAMRMWYEGVWIYRCELFSGHRAFCLEKYTPRPKLLPRTAQRAKLAAPMCRAFNRLKELRAAGDMLGIRQQLKVYRQARDAWEAV